MFQKFINKAIDVIVLTSMTGMCLNSEIPTTQTEYEKEPIEIIDTVSIKPTVKKSDPVKLIKEEITYTKNWDEGCEDNTIQLTQYDAYLLMSIASAEALNQGKQGMLMIMQTIMNRVNSPDFPNSVYEVVAQPGQFSTFTSGAYKKAKLTAEVHLALAELEMNTCPDEKLIAFESVDNGNVLLTWFEFYKKYKNHVFYKQKKLNSN